MVINDAVSTANSMPACPPLTPASKQLLLALPNCSARMQHGLCGHCTVDCWKTCYCVYADSSRRQNKRVWNYAVIKFMQRKTSWGLGRGHCPLPRIFFRFWVWKWRLLVHCGYIAAVGSYFDVACGRSWRWWHQIAWPGVAYYPSLLYCTWSLRYLKDSSKSRAGKNNLFTYIHAKNSKSNESLNNQEYVIYLAVLSAAANE